MQSCSSHTLSDKCVCTCADLGVWFKVVFFLTLRSWTRERRRSCLLVLTCLPLYIPLVTQQCLCINYNLLRCMSVHKLLKNTSFMNTICEKPNISSSNNSITEQNIIMEAQWGALIWCAAASLTFLQTSDKQSLQKSSAWLSQDRYSWNNKMCFGLLFFPVTSLNLAQRKHKQQSKCIFFFLVLLFCDWCTSKPPLINTAQLSWTSALKLLVK